MCHKASDCARLAMPWQNRGLVPGRLAELLGACRRDEGQVSKAAILGSKTRTKAAKLPRFRCGRAHAFR